MVNSCLNYTFTVTLVYGIVFWGDIMSVSDAHKRASKKWNTSKDNLMIRPSKEEGAAIRAAAATAGQSNQQYILQAVRERMERDKKEEAGD